MAVTAIVTSDHDKVGEVEAAGKGVGGARGSEARIVMEQGESRSKTLKWQDLSRVRINLYWKLYVQIALLRACCVGRTEGWNASGVLRKKMLVTLELSGLIIVSRGQKLAEAENLTTHCKPVSMDFIGQGVKAYGH